MQLVQEIYDLLYSPILTPYNLLANIKLNNYEYVNYYKDGAILTCEMKCTIEGVPNIFFYLFDEEDNLQKIYQRNGNMTNKRLVFNRENEIRRKTQDFKQNKIKESSSLAG